MCLAHGIAAVRRAARVRVPRQWLLKLMHASWRLMAQPPGPQAVQHGGAAAQHDSAAQGAGPSPGQEPASQAARAPVSPRAGQQQQQQPSLAVSQRISLLWCLVKAGAAPSSAWLAQCLAQVRAGPAWGGGGAQGGTRLRAHVRS